MDGKQTKDVVDAVKKRGRPKGSGGNVRLDQQVVTEPGDNTKYLTFALALKALPKVDMKNPEEVAQRVTVYFETCAEHDIKPGMASLALSFGLDRRSLWEYINGKMAKNREVSDTLKKASQILDTMMENYMQNGKINPVSGIFLMKNNFGYQDKQEVVVTPSGPLDGTKDTKALEAQYVDSVVDED